MLFLQVLDQLFTSERTNDVFDLITSMENKCPSALYQALKEAFTSLENGAIIDFESALQLLFTENLALNTPITEIPGSLLTLCLLVVVVEFNQFTSAVFVLYVRI